MEGWMISTMRSIGFYVNNDAFERMCMSDGGPVPRVSLHLAEAHLAAQ